MAIIKPIETPSGTELLYWRMVHIEVIPDQNRATILWSGYLNADARASGKVAAFQVSEDVPLSREVLGQIYQLASPESSTFADGEPYITDPWKDPQGEE